MNLRRGIAALLGIVAAAWTVSSATALDEDVVPFSDKFPVMITVAGRSDVETLARLDIDIDSAAENWVRAYVSPSELEHLKSLGFEIERTPNQALRMWRSLQEARDMGVKDVYHDYEAVTAYLEGVAADHPAITQLVSAGRSVQGRELWFLKITDNPGIEEDEPEFKYISTMHGDEPVGTENCLKFIDLLTDNYDSPTPDEELKHLVDEIEIWIMPMMNPDGNAAGSRYNAHGVDLNRSFPDWFEDPDNTPVGREPEIAAVMSFTDSMTFDLSANFHAGALVVNYPWDNRPALCPDNDLFIAVSEAYSVNNPPMWSSSSFYHGITNGYAWYEVHGSMQDWNYQWMKDKEVTIELSNVKWPPTSQLPQLWDDNDEAMTAYLEYCLRGVRGVVTDSAGGEPLAALVTASGISWDDHTDPDLGDYHRILLPGTYTLTFSSPGYVTKEIAGVTVTAGDATVLDVELGPAPLFSVWGTVTSDTHMPLEAGVEFTYHDGGGLAKRIVTDPLDGSYATSLPGSEYDIAVSAEGFVTERILAEVGSDTTFDFELRPTSGTLLVVNDGSGSVPAEDLVLLGFEVNEETAAASSPEAWPAYDLVVWSSGRNTAPVSQAAYRRNLIDFVAMGGRLLIEGGEIAYDAVSSPGYPDFADSVLHVDAWDGDDVGSLELDPGRTSHPLATEPNLLAAGLDLTYSGWGSEDAAHPAADAYQVYAPLSEPTDGGVLVFEGQALLGQGQVVFFAFAYADLADRSAARDLLENTVAYLGGGAASVEAPGRVENGPGFTGAFPNPFRSKTEIAFSIPTRQTVRLAVYDVRGRLVRTLLDGIENGGPHRAVWHGEDNHERQVPAGIYFVAFKASGLYRTAKVLRLE